MTTKTLVLTKCDKIGAIENLVMKFDESKDLFITICDDKSEIRSKAQNALTHVYYSEIAEFMGDDIGDVGARCKRKFGLPIMRVQSCKASPKGDEVYMELNRFGLIDTDSKPEQERQLIKYYDLSEVGQLECFKMMKVTRNFNSTEMKQYIESIERYFAEQGLVLESVNETKRREAFYE